MDVGIPELADGALPPGRHRCTQEEFEQRFVAAEDYAGSRTRPVIWQHWQAAVNLLQSAAKVHVAWIGGSFTTVKPGPRDIDVTFMINEEDWLSRDAADRTVIESFQLRVKDALTGRTVPRHGLLVDSFIVKWTPHQPLSDGTLSAEYESYAADRGYWDDWWSRRRESKKTEKPVRTDALPRRGYLEVLFDEYE